MRTVAGALTVGAIVWQTDPLVPRCHKPKSDSELSPNGDTLRRAKRELTQLEVGSRKLRRYRD